MTRRVTRTERDGKITVLADSFEGKRLNSPNDIVVKSDDSLWFTDPLFGINGEWEGTRAKPDQATTNVYRIGADGKVTAVITDIVNPNGLAFSPDEKKLYVVEWRGTPNRSIWSFDVNADGTVTNKTKLIDAADQGALDGFKVDRDGNLWCGWGSNGALNAEPADVGGRKVFQLRGKSEDLDGVMVFNSTGKAIAHIRLPERCANLCFGGPKKQPGVHGELSFPVRAVRGITRRCLTVRRVQAHRNDASPVTISRHRATTTQRTRGRNDGSTDADSWAETRPRRPAAADTQSRGKRIQCWFDPRASPALRRPGRPCRMQIRKTDPRPFPPCRG